ncbi:hypothetical protein IZY60_02195 [Lutibacter sp. B2]|nr:hypothetical protein [Lutibacter sp. B2]
MKFKRTLLAGLLGLVVVTGCTEAATMTKNTVTKESQIKTEKTQKTNEYEVRKELGTIFEDNLKVDDSKVKIKQKEAEKIALDAVKKYFNEEVNIEDLVPQMYLFNDEVWNVNWIYADDFKGGSTIIQYGAGMDATTGELLSVTAGDIDLSKKPQKVDDKELRKIALNFIEENKLTDNIKDLEYIGAKGVSERKDLCRELMFRDKNQKGIFISIDLVNQKVDRFSYRKNFDDQQVKWELNEQG